MAVGKGGGHGGDGLVGGLVFPDPHDRPSLLGEECVVPAVALDRSVELGLPPVTVGLRAGRMVGTAVPEATVDEYGDPLAGKYDVGGATQRVDGPDVLTEAEPSAV